MSPEPKKVSAEVLEENLGSLRGCLVEGDAEQLKRQRRLRRRALAVSILFQSAVLAALILVPLFGKAERISLTIVTPIPPYSAYRDVSHHSAPSHPHQRANVCRFCQPLNIPPTIVTHEDPSREAEETPIEGIGENIPGATNGFIPLSDPRQHGPVNPQIQTRVETPRVLKVTRLDPAMLIHRVEPLYPALGRQLHRDGHVEMRAIIGTDGTIQSLQIIVSDPLFDQSALDAVRQWRYRATILNGQPVEIDTYITVVYTLQH